MIEDEKFDLHIRMKSGKKYLFELSKTELDWLNEVINIFEIEYLKYEKAKWWIKIKRDISNGFVRKYQNRRQIMKNRSRSPTINQPTKL